MVQTYSAHSSFLGMEQEGERQEDSSGTRVLLHGNKSLVSACGHHGTRGMSRRLPAACVLLRMSMELLQTLDLYYAFCN